MTAKEARQLSINVNNTQKTFLMSRIRSAIKYATNKGEFKAFLYEVFDKETSDILKHEGYILSFKNDRNEHVSIISW